jgi:hypothetical protein
VTKLDIAILNLGHIRASLLGWTLQLLPEAKEHGVELGFLTPTDRPVCQNRNKICSDFMHHDADILMMIDEDMQPQKAPWDLCNAMMAGDGHDIIAYMSPAWKPHLPSPVYWVAARLDENERFIQDFDFNGGGLMEMDAVGSGVMLIHRRVLEHPDMRAPFMDGWDDNGSRNLGHDYNFCIRAKRLGFRTWVATDHMAGHAREIELLDIAKLIGSYEQELQYRNEQIRALGGEPLSLEAPVIDGTTEAAE